MAENDRHSEMNLATVENEEPTTIQQPPMSESLDVKGADVEIGWTETELESKSAGNEPVLVPGSERSARFPKVERRRAPRTPKPHLFVTLTHWAMVILLGLSFVTGVRLTWGYLEAPFRSWSMPFESMVPKGTLLGINIITLHVVLSFLMLGIAGIYAAYMFRSGASRRLRVNGQTFQ